MEICFKTFVHNRKEDGNNKILIGGKIPLDENFKTYEDRSDPNNPFADMYQGKRFDLDSTTDFNVGFVQLMMNLTLTHGEFDIQQSCSMLDTLKLYEFEDPCMHDILNLCDMSMFKLVFENEDIVKYRQDTPSMMTFELDVKNHNFRANFKSREMQPILFDVSFRVSST